MSFTTVGFLEDIDPAGIFEALAALADQHVTIVGDDIRIPSLNQVVAIAGGSDGVVAPRLRLVSPTLRRRSNFLVAPLNVQNAAAVEPDSPHAIVDLRANPLVLVAGENLNAELLSNPAAVQDQWCIVWLADGPIVPVTGPIFSVRVVSATAAVANVWTNVPVVFDEDLPRGRYQIVGLRPMSAGCVAARIVLVGVGVRPGALGTDVIQDIESPLFRYGQMGVFGEFEDTDPPTLDILSISADAAQEAILDLIQLREGPG